jgi:hypothetical protein
MGRGALRARDLNEAVGAANPVPPTRPTSALGRNPGALLEAVAGEPVPAAVSRPRRPHLPTTMLVVLASLATLAAGIAFTAPGRAVANCVGEQIGLSGPGEPGGPPALRQLNESWGLGGPGGWRGDKFVLLVGPVTGEARSRWEFILSEPEPLPNRPTRIHGPCFQLDLTQRRSLSGQGCGVLPANREFSWNGVGGGYGHAYRADGDLRLAQELFHVTGRVGPAVTAVEAEVNGRPVAVQLRPVPADLRRRFHLGPPFSFFVGFFDGVARGGSVEVTALGVDGQVLGHANSELPNLVQAAKFSCRGALKNPEWPRRGREECLEVLGRGG